MYYSGTIYLRVTVRIENYNTRTNGLIKNKKSHGLLYTESIIR